MDGERKVENEEDTDISAHTALWVDPNIFLINQAVVAVQHNRTKT